MRIKLIRAIRKPPWFKLWSAITAIALTLALVLTFLPMQVSIDTGGLLSISLSPSQTQAQKPAQSSIRPGFGWAPRDFSTYAGGFTAGQIYNVTCPDNINSGSGVSFSFANYTLTYHLSGGKMQWTSPDGAKTKSIGAILSSVGAIQPDGEHNKVAYVNAFLNTTVEYRAYSVGVKEVFVLSQLPYNDGKIADSYLEYTGELTWDSGLSAWIDGIEYPNKTFNTSSSVDFRDIATNETVFSFLAPVAWDSTGSRCSAVYDVKVSADKVQYGLRVPYSWLETAAFPVTIDPSFTARTETYVAAALLTTPFDATVDKPTGTAEGDILFTHIFWRTVPAATIDSVPSDWTHLATNTDSTYERYAIYYKIAGASEPSSYTWSFSASCRVRITCSCYSSGDFDAGDPIDVISNTAYLTDNTIVRAASMSVASTGSPLVFWGCVYEITGVRTFEKPSAPTTDWVEDDDAGDTASDMSLEICSMIWSGSGASDDMDATISATDDQKHAFAVALNPAAAAEPEITNTPDNYGFGTIAVSGTGVTGLDYFTITNTGNCAVDITIQGTDVTNTSLYESYTSGDDSSADTYGVNWWAQSFTSSYSHDVTSVSLLVYRTGSPGTVTAGIRATDVDSKPTGDDLCSGTTNGDTLTTDSAGEWRTITLDSSYNLVASTKYAIVVRATSGDGSNLLKWRIDSSSASYSGGTAISSSNSGSSWGTPGTLDLMFKEYGFISWDLADDGSPGENIYALKAGLDGGDYTIIVRETATYNTLKSNLAEDATQGWGLKIYTPTSLGGYDARQMSGTVTLVASEA